MKDYAEISRVLLNGMEFFFVVPYLVAPFLLDVQGNKIYDYALFLYRQQQS